MRPDLRRIQLRHWGLVAAAAVLSSVLGRPGVGGVVLGGAVVGLSVLLYAIGLGAILGRGRRRLAIGVLFVKLPLLLGLTWVAFTARQCRADPIGFALGVACFPAAAVWEALRVGPGRG